MFVSPKKKGSPVLWIACFLLLFDLRVFGVMAASEDFATSVEELPSELKSFVDFTKDGNITVAIKGSGSLKIIPLIASSSSALSFRASLKGCPNAKQTWKFEYPTGSANTSLNMIWGLSGEKPFFDLHNGTYNNASVSANQNELVDVVLNGSEPVLKNVNKGKTSEKDKIGSANAPSLPDSNMYNMSISVNPITVSDGCVLTLEFDKGKFYLAKATSPTSAAKPATPTPENEKAGFPWIIIVVVVVVVILVALIVGVCCCLKRRRRNTGSKAGHSERGDEFTCVSQTVAKKAEDSKTNKVAAISLITENKDDLKAANERVAIKPKTPKEAPTQKSDVSSMSTKMAQESQVIASKESQADGGKVNSAV